MRDDEGNTPRREHKMSLFNRNHVIHMNILVEFRNLTLIDASFHSDKSYLARGILSTNVRIKLSHVILRIIIKINHVESL